MDKNKKIYLLETNTDPGTDNNLIYDKLLFESSQEQLIKISYDLFFNDTQSNFIESEYWTKINDICLNT